MYGLKFLCGEEKDGKWLAFTDATDLRRSGKTVASIFPLDKLKQKMIANSSRYYLAIPEEILECLRNDLGKGIIVGEKRIVCRKTHREKNESKPVIAQNDEDKTQREPLTHEEKAGTVPTPSVRNAPSQHQPRINPSPSSSSSSSPGYSDSFGDK